MIIKLIEKYKKEAVPAMMQKLKNNNPMAVPRIEKVVVNCGFGKIVTGKTPDEQRKFSASIAEELALICGQQPTLTRAKKSISTFKTRKGQVIGAAVVLRGKKMYDFLERLINITLPRTRDFRGIDPEAFDEKGNLSIGVKEHISFPEVMPEKAKNIFGLELTVVTTASSREEGRELLKLMGFPIKTN